MFTCLINLVSLRSKLKGEQDNLTWYCSYLTFPKFFFWTFFPCLAQIKSTRFWAVFYNKPFLLTSPRLHTDLIPLKIIYLFFSFQITMPQFLKVDKFLRWNMLHSSRSLKNMLSINQKVSYVWLNLSFWVFFFFSITDYNKKLITLLDKT